MIVRIRQKQVLYREITLNTENCDKETLVDYIRCDNIADEEITEQSYYETTYKLDNEVYKVEQQEYYNSMYPSNKAEFYTVIALVEEAYEKQE